MAKQLNPIETSFVYPTTLNRLKTVNHGFGVTLLTHDKAYTGGSDDTIYVMALKGNQFIAFDNVLFIPYTYEHIAYAKLLATLEQHPELKACFDEPISRTALVQKELEQTPRMRFKNRIPYMEKIGLKPWHHMLFVGNMVISYVWDIRVVEHVMAIDDVKGLSRRMLQPVLDDNTPLVWLEHNNGTEWQVAYRNYANMVPCKHPCFMVVDIADELESMTSNAQQQ